MICLEVDVDVPANCIVKVKESKTIDQKDEEAAEHEGDSDTNNN